MLISKFIRYNDLRLQQINIILLWLFFIALFYYTVKRKNIFVYLSIDSFSTKLENAASKVVKDGPSVSTNLTYEDQHQPQRKVNIILFKKKTTNYLEFIYMCLSCIFYPLYISILFFFNREGQSPHSRAELRRFSGSTKLFITSCSQLTSEKHSIKYNILHIFFKDQLSKQLMILLCFEINQKILSAFH